jgi:cell division septum initiation protein DivIVA
LSELQEDLSNFNQEKQDLEKENKDLKYKVEEEKKSADEAYKKVLNQIVQSCSLFIDHCNQNKIVQFG